MRALLDSALAVMLAPRCLACEQRLERPTSSPICDACWSSILPHSPPLCVRCGDALPAWRVLDASEPPTCVTCRSRPPVIACGRSAGRYEGPLREAIHALKYDGRVGVAGRLAVLMEERGRDVLDGADVLVPVPLHWRRHQARGFNQSILLATHLALPSCGALRRHRGTAPQVGLTAHARARNVSRAFAPARGWLRWWSAARDPRRVRGAIVVLVDDVSTTGATLDACGLVLLEMGAREVRALTAARAPAPGQ